MSRIGKRIIAVPEKTTVSVADSVVSVKGPGGELTRPISSTVSLSINPGTVEVKPGKDTHPAVWGATASHIANMVEGVNKAFEKKLVLEGIGYKADASTAGTLSLALGFSHPIKLPIPTLLKVVVEKNVITISGLDKEAVGQFSAKIRALKKPEPYKGKGIRYSTEVVKRKQGKRSTV